MGKNKSKKRGKTDWAARTSAMRKIDNELKKLPKAKAEGGKNRGRKADTSDND